MINLRGLNGPDHARLRAFELGRSHFEAFQIGGPGRTVTVWVFDSDGHKALTEQGIAAPVEPAAPPEPEGPRPIVPVPIAIGARSTAPVPPTIT